MFIRQDETRSKLSAQVAANLNQRISKKAHQSANTEGAVLLKNHRQTTGGGLFWAIIATIVLAAALVYLLFIY